MEFQNVQLASLQAQFHEKSPTPRPTTAQPLADTGFAKGAADFYRHCARSRSPSPFKEPAFQKTKANLFPQVA